MQQLFDKLLCQEFLNGFEGKNPFTTGLGEFVYARTYSRKKDDGTNESFLETCDRIVEGTFAMKRRHMKREGIPWDHVEETVNAEAMFRAMWNMKFLPPGRGMFAIGTGITKGREVDDTGALYTALNNCAFVSTQDIDKDATKPFCFCADVSMLGVGVGFDVRGAGKIWIVDPGDTDPIEDCIAIDDSREGWVDSIESLLSAYFYGTPLPIFEYHKIRKKGEPIRTFGGTSSGYEPLKELHEGIKKLLDSRIGEKITSTDIADIFNQIGRCVVSGNVRRSAQIALGEAEDNDFRNLKNHIWDQDEQKFVGPAAHRSGWSWASNNSVFVNENSNFEEIAESIAVNGEPGVFFLENSRKWGRIGEERWDNSVLGTNPCGEISLASYEFCCLSEIFPDRCEDLSEFLDICKIAYEYAKIVTTGDSHIKETREVTRRNRRIGVSQSGITQFIERCGIETWTNWCQRGYQHIRDLDAEFSAKMNIPKSVRVTTVKPSGTISILANASPGIHHITANHFIRRVRVSEDSPLVEALIKSGHKVEKDVYSQNTMCIEFPTYMSGVTIDEVTIEQQFELAVLAQLIWADNAVSCTVTFGKHESKRIAGLLKKYAKNLKGISLLPNLAESAVYAQAPYEKITEEEYRKMVGNIHEENLVGVSDGVMEIGCDGESCSIL